MLVRLDTLIKDREMKNIKYLFKDRISKRELEDVESAVDLWEKLEERDLLGPDNLECLKEIVDTFNPQLVNGNNVSFGHGPGMCHTGVNAVPIRPAHSGPTELEKCVLYLSKRLGRDWKFCARYLSIDESDIEESESTHRFALREQIHECLRKWLIKNQHLNRSTMLNVLKDALRQVGRNDLVEDIDNQKYNF
ncbi:hypothetical protein ScPMuIL_004417 [Solemya velum]